MKRGLPSSAREGSSCPPRYPSASGSRHRPLGHRVFRGSRVERASLRGCTLRSRGVCCVHGVCRCVRRGGGCTQGGAHRGVHLARLRNRTMREALPLRGPCNRRKLPLGKQLVVFARRRAINANPGQ